MRIVTAVLLIASFAASAASSAQDVSYHFTGVVTSDYAASSSYPTVAVGTPVSGTFTLDYNYIQYQVGTIGSTHWYLQNWTGSSTGVPGSPTMLFESTVTAGGINYHTDFNSYSNFSSVAGGFTDMPAGLGLNEQTSPNASGSFESSMLQFFEYSANGLPALTPSGAAYGSFAVGYLEGAVGQRQFDNYSVSFSVTSLTPISNAVPELPASVPLGAGIAVLLALGLVRKPARQV